MYVSIAPNNDRLLNHHPESCMTLLVSVTLGVMTQPAVEVVSRGLLVEF